MEVVLMKWVIPAFALALFVVGASFSQAPQNANKKPKGVNEFMGLPLRRRMAMTRDYYSVIPRPGDEKNTYYHDYLSNRLACPSMPLADNITLVGNVTARIGSDNIRQFRSCDDFEKMGTGDRDMTFTFEPSPDSRNLIFDVMGIRLRPALPNTPAGTVEAELIPCAPDGGGNSIFPGWRQVGADSVAFNDGSGKGDQPFWESDDPKQYEQQRERAIALWHKIDERPGQCVKVTGALVVDCQFQCNHCSNESVELHPVYRVELLEQTACK
jgi:hypothetical protein